MHWPVPAIDHYVEAWKGMIELQKEGLIKSIGVCNFQIHHLQRLIDETGVTPVINQIELHPLMQQRQLHAWNATHKIQTESWSPLAQGGKGVFDQKVIRDLADKYGKTPAQIVIRWHLDSGLVVIPKSVTPSRIAENFDVWDFRLDKDELGEIAKLDQVIHAEVKDFHDRSKTPENATSVAELRLARSRCGDVASDAIRPVSPV